VLQFLLMIAMCRTKLGKYDLAQLSFRRALEGFLGKGRIWWFGTSQPNWLADAYVLAWLPQRYVDTFTAIESYKEDPRLPAPVAMYAYSLMRLIAEEAAAAAKYADSLLKQPKLKDLFAAGQAIQAIIALDQPAFDDALGALLQAHRGMAKFGALRETPEGYLCLPAMAPAKVALDRGMAVKSESEYLSQGYLDYLRHQG